VGAGQVERVFDALGDPGRRALVASVAARGTATATELAAELPVTRQAVAKQLGALADAAEWLVEMGARWDERLAALGRSLSRARAAR
jgi:predicted transcriptional regulator